MSIRIGTIRRRRGGSFVGLILATIFFFVSVVIGGILIFPGMTARLAGVETQGVVRSVDVCPEDNSSDGGDVVLRSIPLDDLQDNVQPTIDFTDLHGQTHEVESVVCGTYGVGEQVALWYLPGHPSTIALDQDTALLVGFGIGLGLVALVCLVFMLFSGGRLLLLLMSASRGLKQQPAYVGGYQPMAGQPQMGGYAQMGGYPPMAGYPQSGGYPASGVNHRVGELVTVASHWAITLTNVHPSQGSDFTSAAPGRFYLVGQLSLRNTSNDLLNFAQTTFRLTDVAGVEYHRAQTMEGSPPGFIQPGAQVSATVAYDVPGTQRQFRLSLYLPMSSLAQATWDITV